MGPKSNDKCLIRDRREDTDRGDHMQTGAEIGMRQPPAAGRVKEGPALEPMEKTAWQHFVSGIWPPDSERISTCCFKPPNV